MLKRYAVAVVVVSIFVGGIVVDSTSDADIPDDVWSKDARSSEIERRVDFHKGMTDEHVVYSSTLQ